MEDRSDIRHKTLLINDLDLNLDDKSPRFSQNSDIKNKNIKEIQDKNIKILNNHNEKLE